MICIKVTAICIQVILSFNFLQYIITWRGKEILPYNFVCVCVCVCVYVDY